jgi:hypothetical protein
MTLKRIVLDYRSGELVARVLYSAQGGPGPNTKARARQVRELVRTGLQDALASLEEGDVEIVGTSGFTTREDILSIASPAAVISETRVKETR